MTGFERWLRDLLDAARLEVGGDDGGGGGRRGDGAGVDVQREHLQVLLLGSVCVILEDKKETNWGHPG